jgi:hypothetical protein
MLSPFELCFTWTGIHARSRGVFNRLSAATVQLDLLGEQLRGIDDKLGQSLVATRAEIAAVARESRALSDAVASLLPGPSRANLAIAVRDTLAPLHRYLDRREAMLVTADIPASLLVAIEPELLRFVVAGLVDAVVALAAVGETIRLAVNMRPGIVALEVRLESRREPPDPRMLEGKLAALRPWLEHRGGAVAVTGSAASLAVILSLPLAMPEER